jgi:subtilisin family serine protease
MELHGGLSVVYDVNKQRGGDRMRRKARRGLMWILSCAIVGVMVPTTFAQQKDAGHVIGVEQNVWRVAKEGGRVRIPVIARGAWSVIETPEWVRVTPRSGNGTAVVTVEADRTSEAARQGVVQWSIDGKEDALAVQQLEIAVKPLQTPTKTVTDTKKFSWTSAGGVELASALVTYVRASDMPAAGASSLQLVPVQRRTVTKQELAVLEADARVRSVTPNQTTRVALKKEVTIKSEGQTIDYGIIKTNAQEAWKNGLTGKGVRVCVLDTGIATHEDLQITDGISVVGGSGTTDYADRNGHGTHVAGIIGARDNDRGVVGIAPQADIVPVKVLDDDGWGNAYDIMAGIEWCIMNKAHVINMSLGGGFYSESFQRLIDIAQASNVVVVAAAGNEYCVDCVEYPAKYRSSVAVSAVNETDELAVFSSTGEEVAVSAPGVRVLSTVLSNGYERASGTSMATPYVSGNVALLRQKYPNDTVAQIKDKLYAYASQTDLGEKGWDALYGFGRIVAPVGDVPAVPTRPSPYDLYAPPPLSVSKGTYDGKIVVQWQLYPTAIEYEIGGARIGSTEPNALVIQKTKDTSFEILSNPLLDLSSGEYGKVFVRAVLPGNKKTEWVSGVGWAKAIAPTRTQLVNQSVQSLLMRDATVQEIERWVNGEKKDVSVAVLRDEITQSVEYARLEQAKSVLSMEYRRFAHRFDDEWQDIDRLRAYVNGTDPIEQFVEKVQNDQFEKIKQFSQYVEEKLGFLLLERFEDYGPIISWSVSNHSVEAMRMYIDALKETRTATAVRGQINNIVPEIGMTVGEVRFSANPGFSKDMRVDSEQWFANGDPIESWTTLEKDKVYSVRLVLRPAKWKTFGLIEKIEDHFTAERATIKVATATRTPSFVEIELTYPPLDVIELNMDKSSLMFDKIGGTKTIDLTLNRTWDAFVYGGDWLTVNTQKLKPDENGKAQLSITAKPNQTTFTRASTVFVMYGSEFRTVEVRQRPIGVGGDQVVDAKDPIRGLVAPVTGATPVTTITPTDAYTGTVLWAPAITQNGSFEPNKSYTAKITLVPKEGYTLIGVSKNAFKVDGVPSGATVTNDIDSGVVTVVFPNTAPPTTNPTPPPTTNPTPPPTTNPTPPPTTNPTPPPTTNPTPPPLVAPLPTVEQALVAFAQTIEKENLLSSKTSASLDRAVDQLVDTITGNTKKEQFVAVTNTLTKVLVQLSALIGTSMENNKIAFVHANQIVAGAQAIMARADASVAQTVGDSVIHAVSEMIGKTSTVKRESQLLVQAAQQLGMQAVASASTINGGSVAGIAQGLSGKTAEAVLAAQKYSEKLRAKGVASRIVPTVRIQVEQENSERGIAIPLDAVTTAQRQGLARLEVRTPKFQWNMPVRALPKQGTLDVAFGETNIRGSATGNHTQTAIVLTGIVSEQNGKKVSMPTMNEPMTVRIPFALREGQQTDELAVLHRNEDGSETTIPAKYDAQFGEVVFLTTKLGTFVVKQNTTTFSDVAQTYWASSPIQSLASKGIISGRADGSFDAISNVTRAEFTKMLVLATGLPRNENTNVLFTDTNKDAWYAPYVAAAVKAGIITGFLDGTFAPNAFITREQMAVMLAKVLSVQSTDTAGDALPFVDRQAIRPYARAAIVTAVEANIVQGRQNQEFQPQQHSTRAETAAAIYRLFPLVYAVQ